MLEDGIWMSCLGSLFDNRKLARCAPIMPCLFVGVMVTDRV